MNGGASRTNDGQVEDEGDNIMGALAVMAYEIRSPRQATVQQNCRSNQSRGGRRLLLELCEIEKYY